MTLYPAPTLLDHALPSLVFLACLTISGVIKDLRNKNGLWNSYFNSEENLRLRKHFKEVNNGIEDIGEEPYFKK